MRAGKHIRKKVRNLGGKLKVAQTASLVSPWATLPTIQNWKDLPHITCCCKKISRKKIQSHRLQGSVQQSHLPL